MVRWYWYDMMLPSLPPCKGSPENGQFPMTDIVSARDSAWTSSDEHEQGISFAVHPSNSIHHDVEPNTSGDSKPALDANRLRRLSFGIRNGTGKTLPAIHSKQIVSTVGSAVPPLVEKPDFHHGGVRPKQPKKASKSDKRGRQKSIDEEEFSQSELFDEELRGNLNMRAVMAASMKMARPRRQSPLQQQRRAQEQHLISPNQEEKGEDSKKGEDSDPCQELMIKAPLGHSDAIKYWSQSLRIFKAQTHPEELALIQFKLAQTFYLMAMLRTTTKEVIESLESCLEHYNVSLRLYNPSRYPHRWGVAALEMGMAFGAMADLIEQEIPRVKPDIKEGSIAEAGFYKKIGIMTKKASRYRQRSLDSIESAREIFTSERHIEERAKAKVEYARSVMRRLGEDFGENRELSLFHLESAIQDYEVLLKDESLLNEDADAFRRCINSGPAHFYPVPVRITRRDSNGGNSSNIINDSPLPHNEGIEESLPLRQRGVKAAYGRALATAGKIYLDQVTVSVGGSREAATQARQYLEKAVEVIPDDTRDRAEALMLLARATIEQSGGGGSGDDAASIARTPSSKALEKGIGHLRAAVETCPRKQLSLRQELHWHLGRLALVCLQRRLCSRTESSSQTHTSLLQVARDAGDNLGEAIRLAQAALEVNADVAENGKRTVSTARWGAMTAVDEMRARIGWVRAELAKLCLTEVAPEHGAASAIENLHLARKIHTIDSAPTEFITATCLLAEAYRLNDETEKSIEAYKEAARASALLVNQLHFVDESLNPAAILPVFEDNHLASERKRAATPSLAPALRVLFEGGIECCLARCRDAIAATSSVKASCIPSEASFHMSATSGGGSAASEAWPRGIGKQKRKGMWTWIPDKDDTPDCPIKKFTARREGTTPFEHDERGVIGRAVEGEKHDGNARGSRINTGECRAEPFEHDEKGVSGRAVEGENHDGNARGNRVGTSECTAELMRWKPEQLKELLINLGLNVADYTKKRDVVERIVNHPRGLAAAAVTAAARDDFFPSLPGTTTPLGTEQGQNKVLVGLTLADYMSPPGGECSTIKGWGQGSHRAGEDTGGGNPSVPGSNNSTRVGTSSGIRGNPKGVRLAPAHIAPPSGPVPQWVLEMQHTPVRGPWPGSPRKVIINRPVPFFRSRWSRPHRGSGNSLDDGAGVQRGILRAQPHTLQAFRFLCRSGQLFLAEQLALAGVWDIGSGRLRVDDVSKDGVEEKIQGDEGSGEIVMLNGGLRMAWVATELRSSLRLEMSERRERIRRALGDIRRLAGPRGAIFMLPRISVETRGAATMGWDVRMVPSQRDVVTELLRFEKWLARSGAWAEQPTLTLLTTCGAKAPRGFKVETGVQGTVEAAGSMSGERVMPSDYPTDEVLAEMVDPYEALLCWYHKPPGGRGSNKRRKFVEDDDTETRWTGNEANGDINDATRIACFVLYHDQGKTRKVDELEEKRTVIGTRVHDRRQDTESGTSGRPRLSSQGGAIPNKIDGEINANDFETGAFRVRMVLADPGTSEKLRRAIEAFLSAMRVQNIVKRNALLAFALQDLSLALGVSKILKALPPQIQELTVVHHGLLAVVPVHALPLEEASSTGEPGRRGSSKGRRPYSFRNSLGVASERVLGENQVQPLAVIDKYSVRYTSSLYALEIAERTAVTAARDTPLYFNACCVVEDPLREVILDGPRLSGHSNSASGRSGTARRRGNGQQNKVMRLKHSRHESRVVGATWSADPEDCHFCEGESATREVLTTVVMDNGIMSRGQRMAKNHVRDKGHASDVAGGGTARTRRSLLGNSSVPSLAEVAIAATADTAKLFASKLNQARCLHLCCSAIHLGDPGLRLCRTTLRQTKHNRTDTDAKSDVKGFSKILEVDHVDTASLIQTLHLRSCGLVVLSRGGVIDDIRSVEDFEVATAGFAVPKDGKEGVPLAHNMEEIEEGPDPRRRVQQTRAEETPPLNLADAFIATGARTVVQKIWDNEETALADTVTLLSFYEELRGATASGEKRPVAVALRKAQLWIRDATINDILCRVQGARGLPAKDSEALKQDLASLFETMSDTGSDADVVKPFTSPVYWAGFQAVGSCGEVHSPQRLEEAVKAGDDDSTSSAQATSPTKGGPQAHGITTLSDHDGIISVGGKGSGASSYSSDSSRSSTSVSETGSSDDARSLGKHVSDVGSDHDRVEDVHPAKSMKRFTMEIGARAVAAVAIVIQKARATSITAKNSTSP